MASCSGTSATSSVTLPTGVQQAPRSHLTYVALGASDTFGTGTDDPQTQSWPNGLANRLGNTARLINLGIPGVHVHEALDIELPVALDARPDLVTVWLAVNDLVDHVSLESYTHDIDLLLQQLQKKAPQARIVVANVPDLTLLPRFQNDNAQTLQIQIASYNRVIAELVQRHHVLLVDLYTKWNELASHPDYISADGFHPNALGYDRLAEIFYQELQKHGP